MGKKLEDLAAGAVGTRGIVVAVEPNPRKGVASRVINLLESAAVKLMQHDFKPYYPTTNFVPVHETKKPLTNLVLKGYLPECLDGEFLMVGPNFNFAGSAAVAEYRWEHGDGMVHGVRIKQGKAVTFVSRFVRTSQFKQQEFHGAPVFRKVIDLRGIFRVVLTKISKLRRKFHVIDDTYGYEYNASSALEYHGGRLLVFYGEYAIKVLENGDLLTIGMVNYNNERGYVFTSHPKIDPVTGELFTSCKLHASLYLIYRVISKDGVIRVSRTLKEQKSSFTFDSTKKIRFGILSRYARDEKLIKWFELPPCVIYHIANAWEEGNEVVLISCRNPYPESLNSELYEMRFNMKSGMAFQKRLSASHIVCPRINKNYTGRMANRTKHSGAMISGIVKFDLEDTAGEKVFEMGPEIFGSEAVFVPKRKMFGFEAIFVSSPEPEDNGYLIFFAHDHNKGKSVVMVIDAQTMSPDPVAIIELPTRVPFGCHSFFMTEDQLREHAT